MFSDAVFLEPSRGRLPHGYIFQLLSLSSVEEDLGHGDKNKPKAKLF